MALKFLNKKGWHTGSLRNIENVWKAEQKREAEQKKLEELRKQIQEERERSEFRLLQEQAGLVPKQERLDFLYDSGLAVGKGSSSKGGEGVEFKAVEGTVPNSNAASSSSSAKQSSVPGALFEDKPQSANDAWRKLHSDPLLLIRQREQEAVARVKNNPVQMALIRKSVEATKEMDKAHDKKECWKKHNHSDGKHSKHSSSKQQSDSENNDAEGGRRRKTSNFKGSKYDVHHYKARLNSDGESSERENQRRKTSYKGSKYDEHRYKARVNSDGESSERENQRRKTTYKGSKYDEHHYKAQVNSDGESSDRESQRRKHTFGGSKYRLRSPSSLSDPKAAKIDSQDAIRKHHDKSKNEKHSSEGRADDDADRRERETRSFCESRPYDSAMALRHDSQYKRRNFAPKLSEEERAARLREMQVDAELHEEQRFKRLRKAEEKDAREAATHANTLGGRNFLDAAHKSVYGAEKGGSSTIEESVRRRTHYSQGRSDVGDGNAFRR